MGAETDAAKSLRRIWQGHDERDEELCAKGAFGLYNILTKASDSDKFLAAKLVKEAFWASDEAEIYQNKDQVMESNLYKRAGYYLVQSRALVGLETNSVEFTVKWWMAYRHKDKKALLEGLVNEHFVQMKNNEGAAEKCASLLLEAAAEHKKKDWKAVDKKLEEYFQVYLSNVL